MKEEQERPLQAKIKMKQQNISDGVTQTQKHGVILGNMGKLQ